MVYNLGSSSDNFQTWLAEELCSREDWGSGACSTIIGRLSSVQPSRTVPSAAAWGGELMEKPG
jgi:hypothetical protein